MKNVIIGCLLCLAVIATTSFADIYKCKGPDGTTIFSDDPCGGDAEVVVPQFIPSVDQAVGVKIKPYTNKFTSSSYSEYITNEAKRVTASILPDQWFISSKTEHVVYHPPQRGTQIFPGTTSPHDNTPGWVVRLSYGSESNRREWEILFRYDSTVIKDLSGKYDNATILRTISIKMDGKPYTPRTMHNVGKMEKTQPGEWKLRR